MKRSISSIDPEFLAMVVAMAVFGVATVNMLRNVEPFHSWYYCFAWWSYIAWVESFLQWRVGSSPFAEETAKYILLLPLSVSLWLVFEVLNFRLANWQYVDVVEQLPWRWFGYWISFATVLPGLFVTQRLLHHLGVASRIWIAPLRKPENLYGPFIMAGVLMLCLPMLWPRYFFPLVWLAFIFLVEPFNHRLQGVSLLRDLQKGDPRQLVLLLLSGALCGFLWECWNYWAGSKWVYTIPFFDFLRVFQMPLLGFLGFPPFAVECYVMANGFFLLMEKVPRRFTRQGVTLGWVVVGMLLALFHLLVFQGIDHFTVASFRH